MARFPSIDNNGAFESPQVQDQIKELVTGGAGDITVDTSVGTRVFVGDTMIHGDTGWRSISTINGWTGSFHVRRIGDILWMRAYNLQKNNAPSGRFIKLPTGFSWAGAGASIIIGQTEVQYRPADRELNLDDTSAFSRHYHYGISVTPQSWPTALPGSPA